MVGRLHSDSQLSAFNIGARILFQGGGTLVISSCETDVLPKRRHCSQNNFTLTLDNLFLVSRLAMAVFVCIAT